MSTPHLNGWRRAGGWALVFVVTLAIRLSLGVSAPKPIVVPDTTSDLSSRSTESVEQRSTAPWPASATPPARPDEPMLAAAEPSDRSRLRIAHDLALKWKTEPEWREEHDLFLRAGRLYEFRRLYDSVVVRPLGAGSREYRGWIASAIGRGEGIPTEPILRLAERSANLNRRYPTVLSDRGFQSFGYRSGDHLEVMIGPATGGLGAAPDALARATVSALGADPAVLSPAVWSQLLELMERWETAYLDGRASLWRAIWQRVQGGTRVPARLDDVAAAMAIDNRLYVVPRGSDPALDDALRVLEEAESVTMREMARIFR